MFTIKKHWNIVIFILMVLSTISSIYWEYQYQNIKNELIVNMINHRSDLIDYRDDLIRFEKFQKMHEEAVIEFDLFRSEHIGCNYE